MEQKFIINSITEKNQRELTGVYKKVFSGHPWHEDLICANSQKNILFVRILINSLETLFS